MDDESHPRNEAEVIKINVEKGWLVLGRCNYLYRDAAKVGDELVGRDETATREMGDGDILIPLPPHMCNQQFRHEKRSDLYGAEVIVAEIRRRLCAEDEDRWPMTPEWLSSLESINVGPLSWYINLTPSSTLYVTSMDGALTVAIDDGDRDGLPVRLPQIQTRGQFKQLIQLLTGKPL